MRMKDIKISYNLHVLIYMRIISFDVGIKNLSVCECDDKGLIQYWDILNLTNDKKMKCTECVRPGKYLCLSTNQPFCTNHAKKKGFLPSELKNSKIVHQDKSAIVKFLEKRKMFSFYSGKNTKTELVHFIRERTMKAIKTTNASKESLVDVSIQLKKVLDSCFKFDLEDQYAILIENQISPIANRMKTVQGMLTQYFVDKGIEHIQYISSKNKLKVPELYELTDFINSDQTSYTKRKTMSVDITRAMLMKHEETNWLNHFESHKKKDDLADSYLQGLWWIKTTCK